MAEQDVLTSGKDDYYQIELKKTVWKVPKKYQNLTPIEKAANGSGEGGIGAGGWDMSSRPPPSSTSEVAAIGTVAYGHVCSALDTERNIKVAIKKLTKPFRSATNAKRAFREIKMLRHMRHANIISLLDLFTPAESSEKFSDVYLVSELMGVDLKKIIVRTLKVQGHDIRYFVYLILRGLKDLKPSNIVLNIDHELRILDFGLARQTDYSTSGSGTIKWYKAPEIILNLKHYSPTVDIWSLGCIMAELITGEVLFPANNNSDHLHSVLKLVGTPGPEFLSKITSNEARRYITSLPPMPKQDFRQKFPDASHDALDLLERMLDLDANRRITASEALAHIYLEMFHDESDEPEGEKFDDSFENAENSLADWRKLVWKEINNFEPRDDEEEL